MHGRERGGAERQVGHRRRETHAAGGALVHPALDGGALVGEAIRRDDGVLHGLAQNGAQEDLRGAIGSGNQAAQGRRGGARGCLAGQHPGAALTRQGSQARQHVEAKVGALPGAAVSARQRQTGEGRRAGRRPGPRARVQQAWRESARRSARPHRRLHLRHQPTRVHSPREQLQQQHAQAVHVAGGGQAARAVEVLRVGVRRAAARRDGRCRLGRWRGGHHRQERRL
mmetsp:Transcript_28698/g.73671  ORF Transcript_28698/g.73671 Transcript_28698/m.73671 type:complete len:227 (-) Transcript_28698:38-718(-)